MQDIYDYLKKKLKERNVRVEDIVSRSELSRTTVYRMMKGLLKPTPQVYDLFIEILDLDERERRELDYYVRLVDVDESLLQARKELLEIIFRTVPDRANNIADIEFIVYGSEKYIKKYHDILRFVIETSKKPSFHLDIKIFNCTRDSFLFPIIEMLAANESLNSPVIEHMVNFSDADNYKNILILKAVLPLMKYNNYTVFYSYDGNESDSAVLFRDLMLIKFSYIEDGSEVVKCIVLSFEGNTMSDCYISEEKGLYEFFARKYLLSKEAHHNSLINQKNIELLSYSIFEFEAGGKTCLIKPSPCYHRIPIEVCKSVLERQSENQLADMISYMGDGVGFYYDTETAFENTLKYLEERDRLSLKYTQTDIYTKDGLELFARERRLSDHYSFLPELTKEEVKAVLENLRRKNNDSVDKFRFYITHAPIRDNNMIYCASETNGVMLEYVETQTFQNGISNCIIKQDSLARMFLDFAENYVPETLAMSQPEANRFIDHLIETYCS